MQEIKFRGKCVTDSRYSGEWVYGSCAQCENGDTLIVKYYADTVTASYHVILETVGQFTGLHDINGKEIYEGDIVQCGDFVYQVIYEGTRFASFGLRRSKDMFMHYFGEAMEASQCAVIGNIHDNPELIKKEK